MYSLKYLRSITLGCKDKGIRKSEFVAKSQFLSDRKPGKLNHFFSDSRLGTVVNRAWLLKGVKVRESL